MVGTVVGIALHESQQPSISRRANVGLFLNLIFLNLKTRPNNICPSGSIAFLLFTENCIILSVSGDLK